MSVVGNIHILRKSIKLLHSAFCHCFNVACYVLFCLEINICFIILTFCILKNFVVKTFAIIFYRYVVSPFCLRGAQTSCSLISSRGLNELMN